MFLASECEWLLWIDDDAVMHPAAPQRLRALAREHGALAAAGYVVVYDHNTQELRLGGWDFDGVNWENAEPQEEAFWVDGVGCHFSLWHRTVYDLIEPPYHQDWMVHPRTGSMMSHDLAISLRFKEESENWPGILYCPEVLTWHVKEWKIGKTELDEYRAANPVT